MKDQQPIEQHMDRAVEVYLPDRQVREEYENGLLSRREADVYQVLSSLGFLTDEQVKPTSTRQGLLARISVLLRRLAAKKN